MDNSHWTDYVPAIVKYPVAMLLAGISLLFIPRAVLNKSTILREMLYRIEEIFSD